MSFVFFNIHFMGGRKRNKERIRVRDTRFMEPRRRGGGGTGCSDKAGSFADGVANIFGETEHLGCCQSVPDASVLHSNRRNCCLRSEMIITDFMGQNPSRNCPHFMGSEGYLVCSVLTRTRDLSVYCDELIKQRSTILFV